MTLYISQHDRMKMKKNKTMQEAFKVLQQSYKQFRSAQDVFESLKTMEQSKDCTFNVYNSAVMDVKDFCVKNSMEYYQKENGLNEIDILHQFTKNGKVYRFNISNHEGHDQPRVDIIVRKYSQDDKKNMIINRTKTENRKMFVWKEIDTSLVSSETEVFQSKLMVEDVYHILNAIKNLKNGHVMKDFSNFKKMFMSKKKSW